MYACMHACMHAPLPPHLLGRRACERLPLGVVGGGQVSRQGGHAAAKVAGLLVAGQAKARLQQHGVLGGRQRCHCGRVGACRNLPLSRW
jgi:hypothetical protein